MEFRHVSILLRECVDTLNPERGGIYVDCTTGGGGHSYEIARRLPDDGISRLICIDRDDDALKASAERLKDFSSKVTFFKSEFSFLDNVLRELGIKKINGIMWDLGVSSYQLDEAERGFSYSLDAPLDMRMDRGASLSAKDVVNTYGEEELRKIIFDYGEEKFAGRIASAIVRRRAEKEILSTVELAEIIKGAMPPSSRYGEAQHPAKRTFQAIRIEVNKELDEIRPSLESAVAFLEKGGRGAVITFHSLEDRIVKTMIGDLSKGCTCPPDFPVCVCGKKPVVKQLSKKPILPCEEEIKANPRARSAKLRTFEKL